MNTVPVTIRYKDTTLNTTFGHETEAHADDVILEEIFAQWNSGSGQECSRFTRDRNIRSLSVGDYVCVEGRWYLCASFGWDIVSEEDVNKWFLAMTAQRRLRQPGRNIAEERQLLWVDARRVEDALEKA